MTVLSLQHDTPPTILPAPRQGFRVMQETQHHLVWKATLQSLLLSVFSRFPSFIAPSLPYCERETIVLILRRISSQSLDGLFLHHRSVLGSFFLFHQSIRGFATPGGDVLATAHVCTLATVLRRNGEDARKGRIQGAGLQLLWRARFLGVPIVHGYLCVVGIPVNPHIATHNQKVEMSCVVASKPPFADEKKKSIKGHDQKKRNMAVLYIKPSTHTPCFGGPRIGIGANVLR